MNWVKGSNGIIDILLLVGLSVLLVTIVVIFSICRWAKAIYIEPALKCLDSF